MDLLHHDFERHILVGRLNGEIRLFAARALAAGSCLFEIEGVKTAQRSRFSVQVDDHEHIEVDEKTTAEASMSRQYFRFLNHSCEPNVVLRGVEVVALRDIGADEELAFDYETTEFDMAEPFECRCDTNLCRGQIRGFRHLTAAQREGLRGQLAPYLLRRIGAV